MYYFLTSDTTYLLLMLAILLFLFLVSPMTLYVEGRHELLFGSTNSSNFSRVCALFLASEKAFRKQSAIT